MDSAVEESSHISNIFEEGLASKELQIQSLGDATINNVPNSLIALRRKLSEHDFAELDVFAALLFILAVECGYSWDTVSISQPQYSFSFDIRKVNAIQFNELIPGASLNEERRFILYLGGCKHFKCILLIRQFIKKVVVNLSAPIPLLCFSLAYDLHKYVNKNEIIYSTLQELSISSKNELFHKMKCHILLYYDIKNVTSLNGLPPEIILLMIKYLNAGDFLNLCKTCRYLFDNFCKDDSIWKYYCKKNGFDAGIISSMHAFCWKSYFFSSTRLKRRKNLMFPRRFDWFPENMVD